MKKRLLVLMSALLTIGLISVAQEYDDIYFNSSKKKETKKNEDKKQGQKVSQVDYFSVNSNEDFVEIENNRDVDEYNRRYVNRDTTQIDSARVDDYADFEYTDRIQRFHNSSVVEEANDAEITQLYKDSKTSSVTIVVAPNSWSPYWTWGVGYRSWAYGWTSSVYSPWYYDWTWGYSGWNWYHDHHYYCWMGHHRHVHEVGGGINHVVNHRPSDMSGGGRRPFGSSYKGGNGNRRSGTSISKGNHSSSNVRPAGRRPSVGRNTSTAVYRGGGAYGGYHRSSTSRSTSYSTPPAASSSSFSRSSSSSDSGNRGGGSYSGGGGGTRDTGRSSGGRR